MRRTLALLILSAAALSQAQVWQKHIAPGLTFYSEYDASIPRVINALHFDMHSKEVKAAPELGQLKVYNDDKTKGRATVSQLVKRTGALAGVNASYFPYTGRPVGLMVRQGELVSTPYPSRPEFGWGPNCTTAITCSTCSATFKVEGGETIPIDSVNDEAKADSICFDTDTGALALAKTGTGTCAIIKMGSSPLAPTGRFEGQVEYLYTDANKVPIQPGNAALMGTGAKASQVAALRPGQRVFVDVHTNGFNWQHIQNCVCGGPYLLKDGQMAVDAKEEGFNAEFSDKRHPRTAVGRDAVGDIWIAVVDGRQSCSTGATLEEMAAVMQHLGCKDAINLDGGGSSTFDLFGLTVNRPSDGVEREVANAILFFGANPPQAHEDLALKLPNEIKVGDKAQLNVTGAGGVTVPNSDVVWSAAVGPAWIDQGGMLRATKEGSATVTAWVHGQVLTGQVSVKPAT